MTLESEELVDIINEKDEVIGRTTRGEAHKRGLLHRTAAIFVFNSLGELLVQKRSMKKDAGRGKLSYSCSGHVDAGEEYDKTAERELEEELGIKAELNFEFYSTYKKAEPGITIMHFQKVYSCTTDEKINFNKKEIDRIEFKKVEEILKEMKATPEIYGKGFRQSLRLFVKSQKRLKKTKTK